jgi:hypothetical protein
MKFTLMGFAKATAVAVGVTYMLYGYGTGPGAGEVFQTRGKGGYAENLKSAIESSRRRIVPDE